MTKANNMTTDNLTDTLIQNGSKLICNLDRSELYEQSLKRGETQLTNYGALVADTRPHTGRCAQDRFVVQEDETKDQIDWGDVNRPISEEAYETLRSALIEFTAGKDLFAQDLIAGADRKNSINVRVITEYAWHSLFMRNMLEALNSATARAAGVDPDAYAAEYTVLDIPSFEASPELIEKTGINSDTFILVNFKAKEVLVANTAYAGEMKKSVFGVLNFLLPQKGIMPMHCSANADLDGNVALFFGLSGTGKTTLSAEKGRYLIGDDEHGWSDEGVFNFEAGCYAKTLALSLETEPEIYNASRRFGATVENVPMLTPGELDYNDVEMTENGRVSYPLDFIPNALIGGKQDRFVEGNPKDIIMLTCDAFGVLPAVAKLTPEQAKEQFMLGYTAKVAGTEQGIKEPTATFSHCFGSPFMPLRAEIYGDLLSKKIAAHKVDCWLVNTGWAGGAYGTGKRMSLSLTRAIIDKIHRGELAKEKTREHSIFGLAVPESIAMPEESWSDQESYLQTANKLLKLFQDRTKV